MKIDCFLDSELWESQYAESDEIIMLPMIQKLNGEFEMPDCDEAAEFAAENPEILKKFTGDFTEAFEEWAASDKLEDPEICERLATFTYGLWMLAGAFVTFDIAQRLYNAFTVPANETNIAVFENIVSLIIKSTDGVEALTEILELRFDRGEFRDGEVSAVSQITSGEIKSDRFYKFLRRLVKNYKESSAVYCVLIDCVGDYGDNRAVSFLRTLMGKYHDLGLKYADNKDRVNLEYCKMFYMHFLGAIRKLGGNTELD